MNIQLASYSIQLTIKRTGPSDMPIVEIHCFLQISMAVDMLYICFNRVWLLWYLTCLLTQCVPMHKLQAAMLHLAGMHTHTPEHGLDAVMPKRFVKFEVGRIWIGNFHEAWIAIQWISALHPYSVSLFTRFGIALLPTWTNNRYGPSSAFIHLILPELLSLPCIRNECN